MTNYCLQLRPSRAALYACALILCSILPSALATTRTVNSTADDQNNGCSTADGDCTLREAIAASLDNDSIDFAPSLNGATITLGGTELGIARNLTIIGPAGGLTVSGGFSSRVFNIQGGTVRMSNLTVADARVYGVDGADATSSTAAESGGSQFGGGIRNLGTLTLTDCRVSNNQVKGGDGGNGYANTTTESFGFSGGAGFGGGIANEASLTLLNCSVNGNAAAGGVGGTTYDANSSSSRSGSGGFGLGGGIYCKSGSTLTMTGCTVSDNYAFGELGGDGAKSAYGGDGGAALGGGLYSAGTATLKNCTVARNNAFGGHGGARGPSSSDVSPDGFGGSAYSGGINHSNSLTLLDCTLSGNVAKGGDAGGPSTIDGYAEGGGLDGFGCIIRNTIIAGNILTSSRPSGPDVRGGVSSQGHNFIGNTGDDGDGTVSSGWVASDLKGTAGSPLDPGLGPLQDNGGPTATMALLSTSAAIDKGDDAVLSAPFNLTTDQRGYPRKIGAHVDIGAFEFDPAQSGPTFTVTTIDEHDDGVCGVADCSLWDAVNAANANADASTIVFEAGLTGTITTTLQQTGVLLSAPVTITGPGAGVITISGADLGRVFSILSSTVTISGLTIANGQAPFGKYPGNAAGGLFNNHGNVTLRNCTVSHNNATFGGGLLNYGDAGSATLTLSQCSLVQNGAGISGGGIYNDGEHSGNATLNLTECTLDRNTATYGAGILNDGEASSTAFIEVTNSTFSANAASVSAGGVYNDGRVSGSAYTRLRNCTFNLNTAGDSSASVYNNAVADGQTTGSATLELGNTILRVAPGQSNIVSDSDVTSRGCNLSSDAAGGNGTTGPGGFLNASGDKRNTDPHLLALANNGGPTDTCALGPTSVAAINAGNDSNAPRRDQRGYSRKGVSDIGAFEFNGIPLRVISIIRNGSNIVISFNATAGETYRLERKVNINVDDWTSVPGVGDLFALTTATMQFTDTNAINLGHAAYRVRVVP